MNVPLRVLGDRVLVRPDVNANAPVQTEGGIYVARSLASAVTGEDATVSVHRGTVVAVGNPKHPLEVEAISLADRLNAIYSDTSNDDDQIISDASDMLRDLVRRHPCCAVGDDILFSHDAGQELTLDGETLIILHESELLAIVEPEGAYA